MLVFCWHTPPFMTDYLPTRADKQTVNQANNWGQQTVYQGRVTTGAWSQPPPPPEWRPGEARGRRAQVLDQLRGRPAGQAGAPRSVCAVRLCPGTTPPSPGWRTPFRRCGQSAGFFLWQTPLSEDTFLVASCFELHVVPPPPHRSNPTLPQNFGKVPGNCPLYL